MNFVRNFAELKKKVCVGQKKDEEGKICTKREKERQQEKGKKESKEGRRKGRKARICGRKIKKMQNSIYKSK